MPHHHIRHTHYHTIRLTEIKRLYWAHSIKGLASSMVTIFIPIYFYRLGYSLPAIMGYFLVFSVAWAIVEYPILRFSNRIGFNRNMGFSMIIEGLHILMLATIARYHWPLSLIAIVWAIHVAMYWANFRACFARSLLHKRIGPAVGISVALTLTAYSIAPAIGGVIASSFGIPVLYGLAMLCFIAAAFPLLSGPEIIRNEPFNLRDLKWRRVWRDLFANMSGEIDDSVLGIVWPLFIFLIVPTYVGVGILSSVAAISSILISLYIGRKRRIRDNIGYLNKGTAVISLTNTARLFGQSVSPIAGINFFNGLGHAMTTTTYDSRYYNNADHEPLLPYVYAMQLVSAFGDILLFGTLFLVSLFAPIKVVLTVGLILAIPAGYAIRLIRTSIE